MLNNRRYLKYLVQRGSSQYWFFSSSSPSAKLYMNFFSFTVNFWQALL